MSQHPFGVYKLVITSNSLRGRAEVEVEPSYQQSRLVLPSTVSYNTFVLRHADMPHPSLYDFMVWWKGVAGLRSEMQLIPQQIQETLDR